MKELVRPKPEKLPLTHIRDELFKKGYRTSKEVGQKGLELKQAMLEYETSINSSGFSINKLVSHHPDTREGRQGREILEIAHDITVIDGLRNGQGKIRWEKDEPVDEAIRRKSKELVVWYRKNNEGTFQLLSSYILSDEERETLLKQNQQYQGDEAMEEKRLDNQHLLEKRQTFENLLAVNIARVLTVSHSLAKGSTPLVIEGQIADMAQFLVKHSPVFSELSHDLSFDGDFSKNLRALVTKNKAGMEVFGLGDEIAAFALHDWLAKTGKAARTGLKIYDTPHYQKIFDLIELKGRKKNGIGGVILFGPPGTGKTELLQEKNRRLGFKTRVINIHHYSTLEDLMGGRAIQLGLDYSASAAQKIKSVLDSFEQESGGSFKKYMEEMFRILKDEDKVEKQETLETFLPSFISTEAAQLLKTEKPENVDWEGIKKGFITHQKALLLRTTLPKNYQQTLEDIVKGELLLAMQNGQRAVLDEVDKAGPNSLGGILTFLSQSEGETVTMGQTTVKIPVWFTVDATSNKTDLDPYLIDRFEDISVTTPPPKDQLMIAGVRLSDDEGKILISEYEQEQLAGFFMYVLPEINQVLTNVRADGISNRRVIELCGYLVDFVNSKRRELSVNEAILQLFKGNKLWARTPQVLNQVDEVLQKYRTVLQDEPYRQKPQQQARGATRRDILEKSLRTIVDSPLVRVVNGLESYSAIDSLYNPRLEDVNLDAKQQALVKNYLKIQRGENSRGDVRKLPIGLAVQISYEQQSPFIRIVSVPEDGQPHTLLSDSLNLGIRGRILACSADGRKALLGERARDDEMQVMIFNISHQESQSPRATLAKDVVVSMDNSGKYIGSHEKKYGNLSVFQDTLENPAVYYTNVGRFAFSPDGKLLLIEALNIQTTRIISLAKKQDLRILDGKGWNFAGDHLLIQEFETGVISNKAFYIS